MMTAAEAITLIGALLADLPEIVTDVETLVAAIKGTPSPADLSPLTPALHAQLSAIAQKLGIAGA